MLISLRSWKIWLYGLAAGVIGGTATAISAILAVPVVHAAGMEVRPLDWQQIKVVAIGAAFINLVAYLKQSPIPPRDDAPSER
jgi:hypothetical protein